MSSLKTISLIILVTLFSCTNEQSDNRPAKDSRYEMMSLDPEQANKLAALPLACIDVEYPNKPGMVLGKADDLREPSELHPAFFGCFDWHSAVHGHWSLVRLLKEFPGLEHRDSIRNVLLRNISAENIEAELEYFEGEHNYAFERTYGWAWLLKLSEVLHSWDDPIAGTLSENLKPLAEKISNNYKDFLPKLLYPIRVGEHSNTAFGLSFAWDYAIATGDTSLASLINERARFYYFEDENCPVGWEPSGFDFLSPCLEEIDIMRRVLKPDEFKIWMEKFAPSMSSPDFRLEPAMVSDRSDGKLVHLDGLNFSRAWVMYGLASMYPEYEHCIKIANQHVNQSLPNLIDDSYEGGHWLGSFAIYALGINQ